jgi:transposase
MQPYSLELRTQVVAALRQPKSRQAVVAERFGVSVPFIKKLLAQERQTGSLAPKPANGGRPPSLDAAAQNWLVAYMKEHPSTTDLLPFTKPVESRASGVLKLDSSGSCHYLIGR